MTDSKEMKAVPDDLMLDNLRPFHSLHGKVFGVHETLGEFTFCDVRGWGFLTGQGQAMRLDGNYAMTIQNTWGEEIANRLNRTITKEQLEAGTQCLAEELSEYPGHIRAHEVLPSLVAILRAMGFEVE